MDIPPPSVPPPLGVDRPHDDALSRLQQLTSQEPLSPTPSPPPLPPTLPMAGPPSPATQRRAAARAVSLIGVVVAVAFAVAPLVLDRVRQPLNWPEPIAGVNVLPAAPTASCRSLPPDSALPILRTLNGVERALASVARSERARLRIEGVVGSGAILWIEALRAVHPARSAWSRAARAPWIYRDDESAERLATWLSEVVAMATLESARAQIEWIGGRTNAAMASLEDLARIGRGLSGGGPLPQVLSGWAVTEEALRCGRRLARLAARPEGVEAILRILGAAEPFAETACEGLRHETVVLLNTAQQILSVLWVGHPPVPGAPRLPGQIRELNRRLLARLGNEPFATQRRLVAAMSLLIAAFQDPAAAGAPYEELRRMVRSPRAVFEDPIATLLLRNFLPELTAVRQRTSQMDEAAAATRWVLAVRHYALTNGRLPSSLDEAVGAFPAAGVPAPSAAGLKLRSQGAHWAVLADSGRAYGLVDAPVE